MSHSVVVRFFTLAPHTYARMKYGREVQKKKEEQNKGKKCFTENILLTSSCRFQMCVCLCVLCVGGCVCVCCVSQKVFTN